MGPPPLYGPWRTLYWAFTGEKKGGGDMERHADSNFAKKVATTKLPENI